MTWTCTSRSTAATLPTPNFRWVLALPEKTYIKYFDFILTILQSYTVLQSTRASLVVDINPGKNAGREYGTILTSNSNGTYFVKSLAYTNRNVRGNVDYERVQNVEGIMLANIVSNPDELSMPSADKKIESRISFNEWSSYSDYCQR